MERAPVDLIAYGSIVTMDDDAGIIADGALAVRGNRIVGIGSSSDVDARFASEQKLAPARGVIIPGLIDCHTHVTQALVRGLIAHELPMIYRIYTPATRGMSPEEARIAASLCASQLLLSGVTTVCEGTLDVTDAHLAAILAGLHDVGIRANVVIGRPDQEFHHAALYAQARDKSWFKAEAGASDRELRRTQDFLASAPPGTDALLTGGICVSSLTGFSEAYFMGGSELARKSGAKMHVHAARDREEVEFCLAVYGKRPIEKLADLGVVDGNLVVAHAMLATDHELKLLGGGGAGVAHSPIECLNILNAVPNIALMRELGIKVGLGCDNAANDMFSVMRAAWLIHTATRGIAGYDPEIVDAASVLGMATRDAARLLGLDHQIGSLSEGKVADFAVLDASGPHLRPMQDIVPELIRYACRGDVLHVVVGGRIVVRDRRLAALDLEALLSSAEAAAARVRAVSAPGRYRRGCPG